MARTPGAAATSATAGANPSSDLATLTLLLGRVGRLNEVVSTEVCQAHGVTPAEVRVMAALREADGPLKPSVLSDRVVQTSGGLTATLRRLEDTGRVQRIADPGDGRVRFVGLTDAGEAFVDEVVADMLGRYSLVLGDLDLTSTLLLVRDLLSRLEQATGSQPTEGWRYPDR